MNSFWKHVTSVFVGTLFAQSIPIIGSLAITRIFSPEGFGEFSTWFALVTFMSVIVTLRLETVLPIVLEGKPRKQAVLFIFIATLIAGVLLFACILVVANLFDTQKVFPNKSLFLLLGIPAVLLVAFNQVLQTWAAVEGEYKKLNIMRITQALFVVIIQVVAGLKWPSATALVLGFVMAAGISFAVAILLMPRFLSISIFNGREFRNFFLRYKKFTIYALPADTLNAAVSQLPLLVVFHRFGSETAGYLALTMRVLAAPVGLVGKAVLDVFKRHAVVSIRAYGNCRELYLKTFMVLLLASLVMALCTIFLAETIFSLAFGTEWVQSSRIAIWLLPMFAFGLIASPLSYMSYLVEKPHIDLLWQITLMIIVLIALHGFSSFRLTLIGYGLGYAVMYVGYILMSYKFSCGDNK